MQLVLLVGVPWQLGAEGNRFHYSEPMKQLAVVVVLVQECQHTEEVHNDIARQGQIVYHIQKNSLNQICSMMVHMHGLGSHRTVEEEEEDRWVKEMVAGGHWEDNSEEDKVVPQHGDQVKIVVEADSWMDATVAAVEVDEVLAEGTGDAGSVDIADAVVPRAEHVAAEITEVGIADLVFPETEPVVGSIDLSEEQLGFGFEGIGLEDELEVANPVVGKVEEVH